MTAYAAPAARPFTVLHIPEPGADLTEPGQLTACCGQPMDPADLWTAVDRQPGDRVVPRRHRPGRNLLMTSVLAFILGTAATLAAIWAGNHGRPLIAATWFGLNAILATGGSAWSLVTADWPMAAWMAFIAALNAWWAWHYWNRRRRKRAPALAGAKSRARVAALVRKAREAARPRRALRPVPGGAR